MGRPGNQVGAQDPNQGWSMRRPEVQGRFAVVDFPPLRADLMIMIGYVLALLAVKTVYSKTESRKSTRVEYAHALQSAMHNMVDSHYTTWTITRYKVAMDTPS